MRQARSLGGSLTLPLSQDRTVKVNFWDLSGNPDYAAVRKEFYKDAQGVRARRAFLHGKRDLSTDPLRALVQFILLFDVSRRETFENLEAWLKESASCGLHSSEAVGIVCGNKVTRAFTQPDHSIVGVVHLIALRGAG